MEQSFGLMTKELLGLPHLFHSRLVGICLVVAPERDWRSTLTRTIFYSTEQEVAMASGKVQILVQHGRKLLRSHGQVSIFKGREKVSKRLQVLTSSLLKLSILQISLGWLGLRLTQLLESRGAQLPGSSWVSILKFFITARPNTLFRCCRQRSICVQVRRWRRHL